MFVAHLWKNVRLVLVVTGLSASVTSAFADAVVVARGGTVTTCYVGGTNYNVHTFTASGTFTVDVGGSVQYLVVGGGGGGGGGTGGGGGAGGYLAGTTNVTSGNTYTVTVGAGGAGGAGYVWGTNGGNSVFGSLLAGGGGGGAPNVGPTGSPSGNAGGSGGGASWGNAGGSGGANIAGQGNAGGACLAWGGPYAAGGGGGAGAVGVDGNMQATGAHGGAGQSNSITGSLKGYAAGGGGGNFAGSSGGTGGSGIGGHGGQGSGGNSTGCTSGLPNTGSGGGGQGGNNLAAAGSGGAGVVILAYSTGTQGLAAVFSASATTGVAPLAVTFSDSSTGFITNRVWDFGDGKTSNTTETTMLHTFSPGTWPVKLIVNGPEGSSTSAVTTIACSKQASPFYNAPTSIGGVGWTNTSHLWLPDDVTTIRGAIVQCRTWFEPSWQALARAHGFAFIIIDNYYLDTIHSTDGQNFLNDLTWYATASGHSELANIPFIFSGWSAGGQVAEAFNEWIPGRTIAFIANKGGYYHCRPSYSHSAAALKTPAILMSGQLDAGYRITAISSLFATNRPLGALWADAFEENTGHAEGKVYGVFFTFFDHAIRARYPAGVTPLSGQVTLRDLVETNGWLATEPTISSGLSGKVYPYADYPGPAAKTNACWLMDADVANLYRGFATYAPAVTVSNVAGPVYSPDQTIQFDVTVDTNALPGWTTADVFDGAFKMGTVTNGQSLSIYAKRPWGGRGVTAIAYNASTNSTSIPKYFVVSNPVAMTNQAATAVLLTTATLNASFSPSWGSYDVRACWGTVNGGANAANWANSVLVGTCPADGYSTNISYTATGLSSGTAYYFTFFASNAVKQVWAPSVLSFTTTAVNDAPVAFAQSVTSLLHRAKSITLTGSDLDNDPLTYVIVASPAHGTLSGTPPNVTYTPTGNAAGVDAFTFKVTDGTTNSAPATVTITLSASVLAEDFEHEWADNALANTTNGWHSGMGDQSSITNPAVGYGPLLGGVLYPLAYNHSALRRILKLNTGGDMLVTPDTDAAFASAKVYVDMMVNFDVCESFPAALANDVNAKALVLLKSDGASTNLYVFHGQREAGAFQAPTFTAVITNSVEPGTWHRLTITLDSTTNGTGAEAFRVRLDGKALVSAKAYSDGWKSRVFDTPCDPDGGTWFLSAARRAGAVGTNVTSLARMGFTGWGYIDDLSVTYQQPIFSYGTILMLR